MEDEPVRLLRPGRMQSRSRISICLMLFLASVDQTSPKYLPAALDPIQHMGPCFFGWKEKSGN